MLVAADCRLPLVNVHVLSIASRANAKSLHTLWTIRAPTFRLRKSESHHPTAPIRTRELSSRLGSQRRILTRFDAWRLHTHASRNSTLSAVPFFNTSFLPHNLCLATKKFFNEWVYFPMEIELKLRLFSAFLNVYATVQNWRLWRPRQNLTWV